MSRNDVKFISICLTLFLLGGFLRLQAGWSPFPWTTMANTLPSKEHGDEQLAELSETVLKFYNLVDKGNYKEAYQLAFETKWQKVGEQEYAAAGLTSQEEFIQRISDEIGSNGMGLNIISIGVQGQSLLPPEEWKFEDRPELWTLDFLPDASQVQSIFEVEVGGVLLGRCSRWDWHDSVLVAHMGGAGGWKLLLPGSPDATGPHHEEWFLDRYPLKGKRIALERR
jgi:hypothetical protein